MRRLTSLELLLPRPKPRRLGTQGRSSAPQDVVVELASMILSVAGYQPLMNSVIRRCPLLNETKYNRHTPVTERSVALLAPRQPKCPHSAGGSQLPRSARRYQSTTGVSTLCRRVLESQAAKLPDRAADQRLVDNPNSVAAVRNSDDGSRSRSVSIRRRKSTTTCRAATRLPD